METLADYTSIGVAFLIGGFICYINVRAIRHPDWQLWHATGKYIWELLFHGLLTYGALWFLGVVFQSETGPLDHMFWYFVVGFYAAGRAHAIVANPPGS